MTLIADTPSTPYYAVIFSSIQNHNLDGYEEMAARMETLAAQQPGYLGIEAARSEIGITVSYWADLASIKNWKAEVEHREAQRMGRAQWYSHYRVRVARVERDYGFGEEAS